MSQSLTNSITNIGEYAFGSCFNLTNITVDPFNSAFSSVDGVLFNQSQTTLVEFPGGKRGGYTIPSTVTSIGAGAFDFCSKLTSLAISNSVTSIGDWAFSDCTSLTNVTIPNSVTNIGANAFEFCSGLTSLTIPNSVTSIGGGAFGDCSGLTTIMVDLLNSAFSTVEGVLFNQGHTILVQYPGGKVGGYTIPNSVTSIGTSAFDGCIKLTSVTIPNTATSIGDSAFAVCQGLTSITIPNSVASIGAGAFAECYLLTGLTIPNSVTSIGGAAFRSCTSLTSVTMGNGVTSIGEEAFEYCFSLTSVTIPDSVTSIGDDAFANCSSLTSLYFEGNAPSLGGTNVFSACTDCIHPGLEPVIIYYLPGTTGWGSTFASLPTALWTLPYPLILTSDPSFGVRTNQFSFSVSWATNLNVVVEAASDLAHPIWSPVQTNAVMSGWFYFSDPLWKNYPRRFYRVRSQ